MIAATYQDIPVLLIRITVPGGQRAYFAQDWRAIDTSGALETLSCRQMSLAGTFLAPGWYVRAAQGHWKVTMKILAAPCSWNVAVS